MKPLDEGDVRVCVPARARRRSCRLLDRAAVSVYTPGLRQVGFSERALLAHLAVTEYTRG